MTKSTPRIRLDKALKKAPAHISTDHPLDTIRTKPRPRKPVDHTPPVVTTDHPLATIRKKPLAAYLNVSPWTLDRWRKSRSNQFPLPIQISDHVLVWRIRDIELWLMQRQLGGTTGIPRERTRIVA